MPCTKRIRDSLCVTALVIWLSAVLPTPAQALDNIPGMGNCPSGSMMLVLTNYVTTLHNIFPIKFAGITVLNFGGLEDYDDSGASLLCVCQMPPPILLRVGFPLHLWEPADLVETVQQPWCSPSVGLSLGLAFNKMSIGDHSDKGTQNDQMATAQAHLISYPVWWLLGIFLDVACMQATTGMDYLYVTELDPCYNNSGLCVWMEPERALFANQVAQLACPIDCGLATAGFPADYFFWCAGCWGGSYPMSKEIASVDYMQANAGLAAKFISKMHRELIMWLTSGPMMLRGYCQALPLPIWKKSQYNLLMLYPSRTSNRQPIGRTSKLWGMGKNNPFSPNYVWGVYRVRDCCVF